MSYKALQLALFTNDIECIKPIEKIVSPLGWQLVAAVMQKQPIQWILEQSVELILLDLGIPNSIELVGSLSRCQPSVPIIVLTTSDNRKQIENARMAGAKNALPLPVNAKQLMAAMHRAIGERATTVSNIIPNFDEITVAGAGKNNGVVSAVATGSAMPSEIVPASAIGKQAQAIMQAPSHGDLAQPLIHDDIVDAVSDLAVEVPILSYTDNEPALEIENGIEHNAVQTTAVVPPVASAASPQGETTNHRMRTNEQQVAAIAQAVSPAANGNSANMVAQQPQNSKPPRLQPAETHTTTQASFKGKVTAVVGLRGGIGRSTIATNLAIAIAQKQGGNVTLVEAHHALSNLSLMLHLHPQRTLATIEDEHTIDYDIIRGYLQQHTSGVNILCAPTEVDDMVELMPTTWSHLIETASRLAPHMIVDTSSAADGALTEVLVKADEILIIADPDIASLRSATALYQNIFSEPAIAGQINIVLNRVGVNGGLDEKTLRKQLNQETIVSLPFDPALTTYAINRGIPFVQSHPRSLMTKRIVQLADFIIGEPAPSMSQPANGKPATKSSFMSFLGR